MDVKLAQQDQTGALEDELGDRLNFMSAITAFNLEAVKLSLHLGFRHPWKMSQRRQERYQMKLDQLPAYEGCPQKTQRVYSQCS